MMKKLCLLLALLSSSTLQAAPSDVLGLGSPVITGNSVQIPVFINDRSGTPLGMDRSPDLRIAAWSFVVVFSNGQHVQSASVLRAGIVADLEPLFEASISSLQGRVAYIGYFAPPPVFTLDRNLPGDRVGTVKLLFKAETPASVIRATTYDIDPDSQTTGLSNGGSSPSSENSLNGFLTFFSTLILTPANLSLAGGETAFLSLLAPSSMEPMSAELHSSHPNVIAVPATVMVPASGSLQIPITARAFGGPVTISAHLNGRTAQSIVTVTPSPVSITPTELNVYVASSREFTLGLTSPRSTPTTVRLDVSDPMAVSVPATLTIPAGAREVKGVLRGLSLDRTFVITATAIDAPEFPAVAQGKVLPLVPVDPYRGSQFSAGFPVIPLLVKVNSTRSAFFDLGVELDTPVIITLISSDPTRLRVADKLTVLPGQRTALYEVFGVAPGSSTVSATLPPELGGATVRQQFQISLDAAGIPALSGWMLMALAAALGTAGMLSARLR